MRRSDRKIPFSEVAKHNTKEDCWIVVRGKVYDASPFIARHPGGAFPIISNAGKDATEEFESVHSGEAWKQLDALLIGEVPEEARRKRRQRCSLCVSLLPAWRVAALIFMNHHHRPTTQHSPPGVLLAVCRAQQEAKPEPRPYSEEEERRPWLSVPVASPRHVWRAPVALNPRQRLPFRCAGPTSTFPCTHSTQQPNQPPTHGADAVARTLFPSRVGRFYLFSAGWSGGKRFPTTPGSSPSPSRARTTSWACPVRARAPPPSRCVTFAQHCALPRSAALACVAAGQPLAPAASCAPNEACCCRDEPLFRLPLLPSLLLPPQRGSTCSSPRRSTSGRSCARTRPSARRGSGAPSTCSSRRGANRSCCRSITHLPFCPGKKETTSVAAAFRVSQVYFAGVNPKFPAGGLMSQYLDGLRPGESEVHVRGPLVRILTRQRTQTPPHGAGHRWCKPQAEPKREPTPGRTTSSFVAAHAGSHRVPGPGRVHSPRQPRARAPRRARRRRHGDHARLPGCEGGARG